MRKEEIKNEVRKEIEAELVYDYFFLSENICLFVLKRGVGNK